MWINWIAIVLASTVCIVTVVLSISSNLLREHSLSDNAPFSLARTQLLWWTDIIAVCLLLHFGHTGALPEINSTCLAVLSIGITTAAIARFIDARQRELSIRGLERQHQDEASRGFFRDILSDTGGLSVHRYQLLTFNVLYGVSFVALHLRDGFRLPRFDSLTLMLLSFSNGGYLLLKAFEQGVRPRPRCPYRKRTDD